MKVFTIYVGVAAILVMHLDRSYTLSYPLPKGGGGLHMKFGFDWTSSFREEDVLKIMVIYVYIVPGRGRQPLGSIVFL